MMQNQLNYEQTEKKPRALLQSRTIYDKMEATGLQTYACILRRKDMKYGYFDLENKEYVITRPDTPAAWSNYLGDPEYGAIITNNAAGYSFVKSGHFFRYN